MDVLLIEGTDDTPAVCLDKANSIFEISGKSLPEDAVEFYSPVLDWITRYKKEPNQSSAFVVQLSYMNTASSKLVQDVFLKLEGMQGAKILWRYQEGDEDMEAMGHEYAELVNVPFEFKTY